MNEKDALTIADGFHYDLPFEDYQRIDALNGSSIVNMRRSPMYYKWALDNPHADTPATYLGRAAPQMILEPDRAGDIAVWGEVEEQKVRRGKVWEQFLADNVGKMIVTRGERDITVGCMVSAHKNPLLRKYLAAEGRTEVTMVWHDPVSGRRFKGRVDKIIKNHTIPDLKTCRSCSRYKFGAQAYQLGYHIKEAIYFNGYLTLTGHEPHMKLLPIESKAPYESAVYRVTKDVILQGLEELDALLKTLAECEESDFWPAAETEETDLMLPTWATTNDDNEDLALEGLEME